MVINALDCVATIIIIKNNFTVLKIPSASFIQFSTSFPKFQLSTDLFPVIGVFPFPKSYIMGII
jgi:hypothetical protein